MTDNPEQGDQQPEGGNNEPEGEQEQTFTQADVDRIVKDRVKRERERFSDYNDLKKKADQQATAEERIADLEKQIEGTQREALKRRVQAAHGVSDEDAELFLTGSDEETLTAQAKRLANRESERKQQGNHVPREGSTPQPQKDGEMREFTRALFGSGD